MVEGELPSPRDELPLVVIQYVVVSPETIKMESPGCIFVYVHTHISHIYTHKIFIAYINICIHTYITTYVTIVISEKEVISLRIGGHGGTRREEIEGG